MKGLLTTKQFAERSGYSKDHVLNMLRSGRIKGMKINGKYWISGKEVQKLLLKRESKRMRTSLEVTMYVKLNLETYEFYKGLSIKEHKTISKTLSDSLEVRFINLTLAHKKKVLSPSKAVIET